MKKRILSGALALCMVITLLPMPAQAALDSRVERAISWAISIANDDSHGYDQTHRNGPDYDCSSLVSTAFRQGGFNVSGSCWTGNMEQAFTAVGFKAYAAGSVTLQRGDILLRHDNTWQHVELYIGNNQCVGAHINEKGTVSGGKTGDQTGHEIDVHSTKSCYFCGGGYTRVLRYVGSSSSSTKVTVQSYFNCDVQINTTEGKRVNLYTNPTDSSYNDYYDRGGSLYSTYGAKLSDGSTWYRVLMSQSGKKVNLWLNAASSGVTIINRKVEPSLSFSPSNLVVDVGTSKTVSINYKGDNVYLPAFIINDDSICSASWGDVDVNTGKAALIVTGKKAGSTSIKINLIDSNRKILYTKNFTVTVNDNRVSVSANPSSLTLNLANNNSGTVRVNINGPHGGVGGTGDSDGVVRAEWDDYGSGYAVAKFTGLKVGTDNFTFQVYDETKTKVVATTTIRITVTAPTYTVSYNANGGSGAPSSQTKQYNKVLTLSSVKPVRAGYTFKGWATSSGSSSIYYQPGSSYYSDKSVTLYAVWEKNKVESSITLSTDSLTLDLGSSKTISISFKGEGIKKLHYTAQNTSICDLNWGETDLENGTSSLTVTGKEPGMIKITVYLLNDEGKSFCSQDFTVSVNSRSYTVSYNANGGNGAPSSQAKQYNKTLTLSSTKPTRDGYTFIGWAESPNASSAQVQYHPGDSFTENKNLTLYAVWMAAKPTHQHDLSYNRGVSSTCTEGGTQEYWSCAGCGKWFADSSASKEITDIHLDSLGHNYVNDVCTRCGATDPNAVAPSVTEVHLPRQIIYFQNQFTDVHENQWFTKNVSEAYELGLMMGTSSNTFDPYGDVTLAQAITMACRIHSIYKDGYENIPKSDGAWYQSYLDYAYRNGIINWAYYNADVENKATRAQFAQIMANALPDEGFYAMNSVANDSIPDVPMSEAFSSAVYKLYRAGILSGGDVNGTFSPKTYITRAEAAAVVSRIAESSNRVSFSLS